MPGQLITVKGDPKRRWRESINVWPTPGSQKDEETVGRFEAGQLALIIASVEIARRSWCLVMTDHVVGWSNRIEKFALLEAGANQPPRVVE